MIFPSKMETAKKKTTHIQTSNFRPFPWRAPHCGCSLAFPGCRCHQRCPFSLAVSHGNAGNGYKKHWEPKLNSHVAIAWMGVKTEDSKTWRGVNIYIYTYIYIYVYAHIYI